MILPAWLEGDLRTDHAGETGAVWIYHGILSVSRNPIVREFAQRHLKTEKRHLYEIGSVLKRTRRSRLLPVWRIAGFITGAVPALIGSRWVFYTIEAVETFVDAHYELQIRRLEAIRNLDQIWRRYARSWRLAEPMKLPIELKPFRSQPKDPDY